MGSLIKLLVVCFLCIVAGVIAIEVLAAWYTIFTLTFTPMFTYLLALTAPLGLVVVIKQAARTLYYVGK